MPACTFHFETVFQGAFSLLENASGARAAAVKDCEARGIFDPASPRPNVLLQDVRERMEAEKAKVEAGIELPTQIQSVGISVISLSYYKKFKILASEA